MLHQQHGVLALQRGQAFGHGGGLGGGKPGQRLVQQQQCRLTGQCHGQLQLAALAVREIGGFLACPRRQPGLLKRCVGARGKRLLLAHAAEEAPRRGRAPQQRQQHVVEDAQVLQQGGDLERARQPPPGAPMHRQMGDVLSVEQDAAGIGRQFAGDLRQQRRLARAVGADEGMQLASVHRQLDVLRHLQAAEGLAQAAHCKHRIGLAPVALMRAHARSSRRGTPACHSATAISSRPNGNCQ